MKTTNYFKVVSKRPDRSIIKKEWIESAISNPEFEQLQEDGRIRIWTKVSEYQNRYLRVILLSDRETVHNAFFDRGFKR